MRTAYCVYRNNPFHSSLCSREISGAEVETMEEAQALADEKQHQETTRARWCVDRIEYHPMNVYISPRVYEAVTAADLAPQSEARPMAGQRGRVYDDENLLPKPHLQDRPHDWENATEEEWLSALMEMPALIDPRFMNFVTYQRPATLRRYLLLHAELGGYVGPPARRFLRTGRTGRR